MRGSILVAALFTVGACETSQNPADGGFVSGVAGIGSGAYDQRITDRETTIAAGQATQSGLQTEIAKLTQDLNALKLQLANMQNNRLSAGKSIPPGLSDRINTAIISAPGGSDQATKIANLRRAIAEAKELASDLSSLAG